ncbi:hypothetical protein F7725_021529 [Dissostichus mawsoni]|uniref:Uncharacterized protein n=1 Tax=Dissostichus mawsoni TaxID=36200 RepID=A0A7J5ZC33_DISMA|nr:hypothetical protein F7725_021529 [Dissostichus mawsoni]
MTVGSRSTNTALGTCFPVPVSMKKVLKESSPPPPEMFWSPGFLPSGWIPCSRHRPSPSPGIISKEDPKLLSPRSWNEDKSIKSGGSKGRSKSNSRPSSRPSNLCPPPPPRLHLRAQRPPVVVALLAPPAVRAARPSRDHTWRSSPCRSLIQRNQLQMLRAAPRVQSAIKSRHPEPKTIEVIPERAPSVQERAPSVSENKVESREASRPASRAETTPLPKRQPSPAPSPKRPTPTPEPKPAPTPVEAEAIVAKPAAKVEPKAESRQKAMALSRSPEVPAESLELEGPNTIMICMVILLNIGLAILFTSSTSAWIRDQ